ncbi:MAG: hypothetical protein CMI70_03920 [Candidatus Pelagibacter sp.]|jgi:hypothetical protein|nr:hypothetical protein [Candidatus Pelagibacter sp.]|tara:strand:+ start:135 stop:1133 length:999 start_codon:yes stop_codon:yes gene_type:complete
MRLIFFSFKNRYRQKELNNFLNTRIYGKYFILNLGGPFKNFIAKILLFLRIGKAISCDGRPLISDKSRGINFWMRGTTLNIPNDFKNLNNNFVTIDNPFVQNKKIFQMYPIKIKKTQIQNDLKIVYMSRIDIASNIEEKNIWDKYKVQLIEDFTLIDNSNFWKKISLNCKDEIKTFNLYKKLKLFLRFEIIENLKKIFNKKLNLIGDDWIVFPFNSLPSNYNIRKIKNMYKGNICLDLGSIEGSISLYPRSIQIIESGGLIIQSIQSDSKKVWKNIHNKILFNNLSDLISLIEKLLDNKNYSFTLLQEISENFRHSDKSIEKSLDKIFNILN